MDKIKLRQICFLFAVMMPITKTIVYPATLAYRSRNDLLWSALCNLLLEGIVIALVMLLAKRTKCTFFDLLRNTFGKIGAKIIYGLFALFFFLSALLPLMEQKNFVTLELYENVPPVISFAPFFALCFYACTKGFKTIGRVADIAMPIFVFCFAAILLLAVPHAENNTPIACIRSFFWGISNTKKRRCSKPSAHTRPAPLPCCCFWQPFTVFIRI